jgi:Peptidase family M23/Putative serine esterase (DUF676)
MFRPLVGRVAGALAALLLITLQTSSSSASTTAADREQLVYRPPVAAPVIDPFRHPKNPFAAGNRGVDYGTSPGDSVHASAPGVVAFAGPVGGALHVVVLHSDGLRTSYSFLGTASVRRGQEVTQGDLIGTAGLRPLHFGARRGDDYVDPLGLLAVALPRTRVRLLPDDGRGLPPEADERSELAGLLRVVGGMAVPPSVVAWAGSQGLDAVARLSPQALDRLTAAMIRFVATGDAVGLSAELRRLLPDPSLAEVVAVVLRTMAASDIPFAVALNLTAWQLTKGPCTPRSRAGRTQVSSARRQPHGSTGPTAPSGPTQPLAPAHDTPLPSRTGQAAASSVETRDSSVLGERRLAVLVGGLGSSSGHAAILDLDTASLGYQHQDTVQFSYRGGSTAENDYSASDTQISFKEAGARLSELLERLARQHPGVPIDVFAHSQGGLVARTALSRDAAPEVVDAVRHLVTFGTPHDGADLAALADAALDTRPGSVAARLGSNARPLGLDPNQRSQEALAPRSQDLREMEAAPLPARIKVTSIAARSDVVVPAPRSWLPGAANVIVGGSGLNAHGALPGSEAALREARLAVTDLPPTCESVLDAVLDTATATAIQLAERTAVAALRPRPMQDRQPTAYR